MDGSSAQLKLQALLAEVQFDYEKLQPEVDTALDLFKNVVEQISDHKVGDKTAKSLAKGFLEDLGVEKCKFNFKCPDSVTLIGSYASRTMAKPVQSVDVAVRIPKSCLFEKDFLNHRYHAKRALYLAVIHEHLTSSGKFKSLEWSFFQQDARKPILVVHPENGGFQLHIIPTIAEDTFDISKLVRGRNNVHIEGQEQPTPNYNGTILEDMLVEDRSRLETDLLIKSTSTQEAVMLVKVWLRQKGFQHSPDALNGFLVSMILLHNSSVGGGQRITSAMSPLQIFRLFLELIGNQDVLSKGMKLQFHTVENQGGLQKANPSSIMILDVYKYANLAMRMSKSAILELKSTAKNTLAAIKSDTLDSGFSESFLNKVDFAVKFDYHVRVQMQHKDDLPAFVNAEAWRVDDNKVENLVENGLKDRATLVRARRRYVTQGWIPRKRLRKFVNSEVSVGIIVSNFETAFRMVEMGPSADDKPEASKFRAFWGEKAELRRFKDGRITETAVWECDTWQRHLIIPRIVEHVLHRHLSVAKTDVDTVSGQLDFALMEKEDLIRFTPNILSAFENFSKRLRKLSLPLKLISVQPLSAAFRQSAVYPPRPHTTSGGVLEPLEVMAQLEGSGKWPNDPIAVQKTKAAFGLQIAECMRKNWQTPFVASEEAVDYITDGFVFRLFISYEKDRTMAKLKGIRNNLAILQQPVAPLHPSNDLVLRSMHASMLSGLQGRHPAYGPTVRLAKRWVAAHLFSDALPEELIELLVAYVFVGQVVPPATRIPGLLRFLRLLASYDWNLSPLIVDINGDLSSKDQENVMAHFRKEDAPAMFVATPYDLESATWSLLAPSKSELKRLVAYAKSSAVLLENTITGKDYRWPSLFRTPLSCYDAVIRLQRSSLPFPRRILFPAEIPTKALFVCPDAKHLASQVAELNQQALIGFNPASEFVKELKEKFGTVFDVWYDALGGDVVGLTLKMKAPQGRKRKRCDELNTSFREIASMGLGLLQSIHSNESM